MLRPGTYRNGTPPGHTPSLARFGKPRSLAVESARTIASAPSDKAPSALLPAAELDTKGNTVVKAESMDASAAVGAMVTDIGAVESMRPAPAPNLRVTSQRQPPVARGQADIVHLPELEPRPPVFLPPDLVPDLPLSLPVSPPGERLQIPMRDRSESDNDANSVVDLDSAPLSTLAPVVQRAEAVFERLLRDDPLFSQPKPMTDSATNRSRQAEQGSQPQGAPFSNSLQTSEEYNDV
jgi:hypothetical protein